MSYMMIVVVTAVLGRGRGAAPHTPDFIGLGAGLCLQVADGLLTPPVHHHYLYLYTYIFSLSRRIY